MSEAKECMVCGTGEADVGDLLACQGCGEPICEDCAGQTWDGRCRDCDDEMVEGGSPLRVYRTHTVDGEAVLSVFEHQASGDTWYCIPVDDVVEELRRTGHTAEA